MSGSMSPAANRLYTTVYDHFRGADFTSDPAQVERSRSPDTVNLTPGEDGNLEKRPGWRTLVRLDTPIHRLYRLDMGQETYFLVLSGGMLYRWSGDDQQPQLLGEAPGQGGCCFVMGGKVWLLTGEQYLVYDGEQLQPVSQMATAPTTSISRAPNGAGAAQLQPVNRLTGRRVNSFRSDGAAKTYQLDNVIDGDEERSRIREGSVSGRHLSESDGQWHPLTLQSVDYQSGLVTFKELVVACPFPDKDNVEIAYEKEWCDQDAVARCTVAALFGLGGENRVFFSGDPEHPNRDMWSEIFDPSYLPDVNYAMVGSDASAILGYGRLGESMAIVKEENGQDSTVYLRAASSGSADAVFPLVQGAAGVGAVATGSFQNLLDEPLFLSRSGVCALVSGDVSALRAVENRSYYLNGRLTRQPGLERAQSAVWRDKYLLLLPGGDIYLLDGRRSRTLRPDGAYALEGYLWQGVPASCLCPAEDTLYFGTDEGALCRLNTDRSGMDRFNDDGRPILARWATPYDDDGRCERYKTLCRYGSGALLKPYVRSGADFTLKTEREPGRAMRSVTMDIFDWTETRFDRWAFLTSNQPQLASFLTRQRKYGSLQIIAENQAVDEGFGVYAIVKRYTLHAPRKE